MKLTMFSKIAHREHFQVFKESLLMRYFTVELNIALGAFNTNRLRQYCWEWYGPNGRTIKEWTDVDMS